MIEDTNKVIEAIDKVIEADFTVEEKKFSLTSVRKSKDDKEAYIAMYNKVEDTTFTYAEIKRYDAVSFEISMDLEDLKKEEFALIWEQRNIFQNGVDLIK